MYTLFFETLRNYYMHFLSLLEKKYVKFKGRLFNNI